MLPHKYSLKHCRTVTTPFGIRTLDSLLTFKEEYNSIFVRKGNHYFRQVLEGLVQLIRSTKWPKSILFTLKWCSKHHIIAWKIVCPQFVDAVC